jgi:hypothetical protein
LNGAVAFLGGAGCEDQEGGCSQKLERFLHKLWSFVGAKVQFSLNKARRKGENLSLTAKYLL